MTSPDTWRALVAAADRALTVLPEGDARTQIQDALITCDALGLQRALTSSALVVQAHQDSADDRATRQHNLVSQALARGPAN